MTGTMRAVVLDAPGPPSVTRTSAHIMRRQP